VTRRAASIGILDVDQSFADLAPGPGSFHQSKHDGVLRLIEVEADHIDQFLGHFFPNCFATAATDTPTFLTAATSCSFVTPHFCVQ